MNRLLEIGFQPAGHWLLRDGELIFDLSRHARQRNILYAFVSDGEVKYVGKTVQRLYARMNGYKNPAPTQTTNLRNNSKIAALLREGAAVDILALPDNGLLHYGKFHINLAAGLEDSLISVIAPSWNCSATVPDAVYARESDRSEPEAFAPLSKSHPQDEAINNEADAIWAQAQSLRSESGFQLVVHKTYYRQGFFNVGVQAAPLLGDDGQEIEIFCGHLDRPIIGTINRTANRNRTPRVMGGAGLRDWFQRTLQEMQVVSVAVLSPNAIRIEPRTA